MRLSVPLLAALALSAAATLPAHASTMDFAFTMTLEALQPPNGPSTLNNVNVDGETLTITGSYDTAIEVDNGNYALVNGDVEYSLNGGADFAGTSPTTAPFDEPYYLELNSTSGVINLSGNNDVIVDSGLSLSGDSLATPENINLSGIVVGGLDATTDGTLEINGVSGLTLTITDAPNVAPTPEPSSLVLLSAGLVGLGGMFGRRRFLRG